MCKVRYFICPMSKNIIDTVLEINSSKLGLLPSRRQVDYNGGYVNEWNTDFFVDYIRQQNSSIVIQRDHAGIGQGDGNEYESYKRDSKFMNIIHVDPWKHYQDINEGINETIRNINFLFNLNNKLKYEVGTEETIRSFSSNELEVLVNELKIELTKNQFDNIEYICIQSGVGIDLINQKNNGNFDMDRLKSMIRICQEYNKLSKEHNGDFLTERDFKVRFSEGLNSINIGPEIVQIETKTYLEHMTNEQKENFYNVCLKSNSWKKWVNNDFNVNDKEKLMMVCGHYNYNKVDLPKIDGVIKHKIYTKLYELLSYV